MSKFIKVAQTTDFKIKKYHCFKYLTKHIAVFKRKDGSFYAIEASCKHQNAFLLSEGLAEKTVFCPRHGWEYDMETGECFTEPWAYLRKFPLKIDDHNIYVDVLSPIEPEEKF
ncbi:MAG: hypothetical protein CMP11_02350 [Zetaproteobacteria bacterium]|nr:hypothetical protein [Pseudobdellovibrionaceae bacterium]|tara:strand:+ start:175 stop:513 length:339 start_codon:yes stop_codon:yes gene_type:complete